MSAAPPAERLHVPGPAGVLQTLVEHPAGEVRGLAVVCHPHPVYGGSMDNKVAYTLARAMNELGHIAVRFNFRGVGESEGSFDGGVGERDDVLAVTSWAGQRYGIGRPWLAGFSFGGCMAVRAAAAAQARRLVLVAPAVERYGLEQHPVEVPLLVVQGMADEVVDAQATLRWAQAQRGPVELVTFEDTGHYFHGAQVQLRRRLTDLLAAADDDEQE